MDTKQANIVYHDWESTHYDHKWAISFDERSRSYAAGRFRKAVGGSVRLSRVLEVGAGTGFFLLNLAQAGLLDGGVRAPAAGDDTAVSGGVSTGTELHAADISAGMARQCAANAERLGLELRVSVADTEALAYRAQTFDAVLGHAVLHHLSDLDAAFAEWRRVLRPGGRLLVAGEPTRVGDALAAQFKRLARIGVKTAAAVAGPERLLAADTRVETEADGRAAALETEVDQHTFAPEELETVARRAGFSEVDTVTEELTANWFGWMTRTVEAMVDPQRLPRSYPHLAYHTWRRLFALDERVARRLLPKALFYNCILTARTPAEQPVR